MTELSSASMLTPAAVMSAFSRVARIGLELSRVKIVWLVEMTLMASVKATALLGNILLKKLAADAGAFETILLESGELTEGSSTTVHVVKDGVIYTPPNGHQILPGTTRDVVSELSRRLAVRKVTAPIAESALRQADEVWLAMATRGILPVTSLDGAAVGSGRPGPMFKLMSGAFAAYIQELAGTPAL